MVLLFNTYVGGLISVKILYAVLIFCLLLLFTAAGHAAVVDDTPKDPVISQSEAYKMLYEEQKEANQKILDTIYWTLGIAFSTLILFVSANTFYNVRVNKKESEFHLLEISKKVGESQTVLEQRINEQLTLLAQNINDQLTKRADEEFNKIQNEVNKIFQKVEYEIPKIRGDIGLIHELVGKYQIDSKLGFQIIRAELFYITNSFTNAARHYAEAGTRMQQANIYPVSMQYVFDKFYSSLQKMNSISIYDLAIARKFVDSLVDERDFMKERALEILKDLQTT